MAWWIIVNLASGNGLLPGGTKPLPETIQTEYQLDPQGETSMQNLNQIILISIQHNGIWKCQNNSHKMPLDGHFVSASLCLIPDQYGEPLSSLLKMLNIWSQYKDVCCQMVCHNLQISSPCHLNMYQYVIRANMVNPYTRLLRCCIYEVCTRAFAALLLTWFNFNPYMEK